MPTPSRRLTTLYSAIACVGCSIAFYWIGALRGSEQALAQFRDLSFQTTAASMQRLLRLDALLAAGQVDEARRRMSSVAWSHYTSLEDDAAGSSLAASARMRESIGGIRGFVTDYCKSGAAAFAAESENGRCREVARRVP